MTTTEFIKNVANRLRECDERKRVTMPSHSFYISDDSGNSSEFKVKASDRSAFYTKDDVQKILYMMIDVVFDALKNGEEINIKGFGIIHPYLMPEKKARAFDGSKVYTVPAHYIPRIDFSDRMRVAAKVCEVANDNIGLSDIGDE